MSFKKPNRLMTPTLTFSSIPISLNQIFSKFTEMYITHKNSLHQNINMKDVPYWGATRIWCHCTKLIPSGFVHPCCSSVSRMILKRNRGYSLTINKLGLDRISLHSSSEGKISKLPPLYTYLQTIDCRRKLCASSISFSWPQEELRVLFIKSW